MAVAAYPATIKVGATIVNDIMTYDLPFKMALVETTAFSGSGGAAVGVKTFIPTLFETQCKATGSWNKADTGQAALETAFFARTTVAMVFTMPNGTNTYSITCWISDYNVKADVKGVVTADFTLQSNSAVTIV